MSFFSRMLGVLFFTFLPFAASAHELRPAYLELKQTEESIYEVSWKVPAKSEMRLALEAKLPPNCRVLQTPLRYPGAGSFVDRWKVRCEGGLSGKRIQVEGLKATLTDVLVRIEYRDGGSEMARLSPSRAFWIVEEVPGPFQVAGTYLKLGVEHILLGFDHLLFVLGLLFLVRGFRRVFWTVTAFTLAHSLTLAAATLGFVRVPVPPVEATIALSIVFVTCEIVRLQQGKEGLSARRPWLVAFSFGLLHGFGFAGALAQVGLPQKAIPIALLFFNGGVELGQLAFIASLFAGLSLLRGLKIQTPRWAPSAVAYAVGGLASFWMIGRVLLFFPSFTG